MSWPVPGIDFPTSDMPTWRVALNELRDAHDAEPGARARVAATVGATGKLTPTAADLTVDTFQGAAADFLDSISLAAVPDGLSVSFGIADKSRAVTLRHLMPAAGDADAGPLRLRDGLRQSDALVLDATLPWVRFQRVGGTFVERERHGFPGDSPVGRRDVDLSGFAMVGARFGATEVTAFPFQFRRDLHLGRM